MGYDERLRRAREGADKTQQGVTAFLGTSQSDYSKQETAPPLPLHQLRALRQ